MKRLLLGLVDTPSALEIERKRGTVDIEGGVIEQVDGRQLIEGEAVGAIEREPEVPIVEADFITTEREIQIETLGRWVREAVMPHAHRPDEGHEQTNLDGGESG